jgi:chromosome segregation ATPase
MRHASLEHSVLDIRDNLRDDERRRREEARLSDLQEQIDELRLLLRESGSRQAQVEEAQGKVEESVAGLVNRIEVVRNEARGSVEARIVELTRLRAEVEEIDRRYAAAIVPIPNLQSQITEQANQVRTKFQELGEDRHRFGELQAQIDRLPPQVERSAEIARDVRDELAAVRAEIDGVRADWRKTGDAVGMVEQDARRRIGDLGVKLDDTNKRIDALKDELPPLEVQIARVRAEMHGALPKFDTLEATSGELREEIDRVAILSMDRHVQAAAQIDQARAAFEERLRLVERLNDTRFSSTMARFGELEEADRAIGHRITLLAVRLEELRDQDTAIRGEMRRLEELRLRVRIEQAQQEAQIFTERLADLQAGGTDDEDDE